MLPVTSIKGSETDVITRDESDWTLWSTGSVLQLKPIQLKIVMPCHGLPTELDSDDDDWSLPWRQSVQSTLPSGDWTLISCPLLLPPPKLTRQKSGDDVTLCYQSRPKSYVWLSTLFHNTDDDDDDDDKVFAVCTHGVCTAVDSQVV